MGPLLWVIWNFLERRKPFVSMDLIAFFRVTGALWGQYASSWGGQGLWFPRGQGRELLCKHDWGRQMYHWRKQDLSSQGTPPLETCCCLTSARILGLPFQLGISWLHRLLLQAKWLMLFVQVPKAWEGVFFTHMRKLSCFLFLVTLSPFAKSWCERDR